MFRVKLSKMAFEMNDLKGILFLVLFAMPMAAPLNINCHGKAFHCVNSTHFMICVDLGGGVSTTIDDFVIPCPATTVCHEENTFECDFPKIEVVPPLQVLGVYEQSENSGTNLVNDSVTIPTTTSDIISEFIENITATTLPTPEEVMPVLIFEEHIQHPTQVDNGNTTDTSLQATSIFVKRTNVTTINNKTNINTIITSTTAYSSFDTVTETLTDNLSDPITGATDLIPVLPENVTVTTSLPDGSTLNYSNANISPTNYQSEIQEIKQDVNAKKFTNTINIVPETNSNKSVQDLTKSNSTTETLINSSTESVNISESVTEAGIVQVTTDMSSLGLVDLILGTQSTNAIMDTANNSTSNFENVVTTVDPYTMQDTNDSGSTLFSKAAMPTETILTDMLISTEQISTTPSINTNLEALNNTDINYNSSTEFNFSDQITTTENVRETTTNYFPLENKTVSSTQRSTTSTYVEVPTTVDRTKEINSTKHLPILFNNNSYQINTDKNKSLLSENNESDVINTTEMIKTQYGVSSTEPTLFLSTSAKYPAIETPTAEKPLQVSRNEVSLHVIKVTNESSVTEPKTDIVQNDTILLISTTTFPNTVTEATLVTEDNPIFSTQFTELISKSPVTDLPHILVNIPKQETVKNTSPVIINTTETANDMRSNSATEARDNFVFSTQFNTEVSNKPTQRTLENNTDITINTIDTANDVMINTATEAIDSSILPTQFTEVISKLPVTDKSTLTNELKQGTVEIDTVITINRTEFANNVSTNSDTEATDNSTNSTQFAEVKSKSPVTDNPTIVNEPKQDIVENKTDVTMNPTDVSNNERTNSASEAVDYSTLSTQFIIVTNKSPVTDKSNTVNESKRTTVENNSVLKTTASHDTKLTSVTELINISTLSANFTKVTNESRDAEPPNIVNEPKKDTYIMKKYSDTEAKNNSTFSVHLNGATNKSPVADNISIRNGSDQDGAENKKNIIIHTTTSSGILKKESVKHATYNSAFSNHFTRTESPVKAYPNVVDEPKQETTENNTVLSASTTTAPNDIGSNSVKDDSTHFENLIKGTTQLPATPYTHTINKLQQNNDVSDILLTSYATAPESAMKESVKAAKDNAAFSLVTTESIYSSNIAGRKQTIVNNSKFLMIHTTTAPDIVMKKSDTGAIDNSANFAHPNVNEPKQESVTSADNYGTEPKVKDSKRVSDLVTNEPAGLITEKNTRIDHVTAKIGEPFQENITTDFTNALKNLETTTTLGLFSTTNGPLATFQDAVATTTYKNNLKNSLTKLFPLKVAYINKTDNIGFVNKDIGTAPNTAMNPDALPIISLPEIPPLNKFVGAPTSSLPEIVDTVSKKDSTKVYEKLLMDGPQNADINVHSTTEYIPKTSTTHAIDGTDYTNIKKISSFGVSTQSIISVTTETAFASLGTSVDWSASDKTKRVNTETVLSEVSTKSDTEPARYTTDKIASSTVINNIDKSIKIVSESDLVNSSNAIPSRKLEPSNLNPLLSPDYIKTTGPQDSSMYITTSDYIPADFTQVENPVSKKFEVSQQKPTTIVDLLKSVTNTYTLPTVEEKTENIKRVSVTEVPLPRNTVFKEINPSNQDFNYVTEKINIYVSSQEILSKLNKIPKLDTQSSTNNAMASTTILPKTFKTHVIANNDMIITDASILITSSTPSVPVENNLKINKELPISSSKPTETKTTEYYSVKPVLPITEVPFVKTTTVASQPSKISTQTIPKLVGETNSDILKTTVFPKLTIQIENNKSTRSINGKTTETVNLVTEPDSMVETIKVEAIPNPVISYTLTDNKSTDGIKTGKSKIDHESIVIGNVYKNNGPSKTTDFKLLEDNSKVEALNPKSDWIKSDIDVDTAKIKETSIEDPSKSSGFASNSGPAIKTFLPIPTAAVQVRPKVNQTADFIQLASEAIHPTIATQIESTILKTESKPITKENQKTVTNAFIRANNKTSDGKLQFQEPFRNTTDSYHMNNSKANVTTSYHKLSLQNNTFNDDLAEHLISTNHTITTEVQNHLNESDKQSNITNYSVMSNITSTRYQNNTALKINSGDKGNSSISVSTPQDFSCLNRTRGKYSDKRDCRKFYTCIGNLQPMIGTCPNNTVFSEINKQCTRNLSHCVRNNQFRCLLEGRFSDFFKDNIYYICVKNNIHGFIRYKLKCQSGYHLNKETVKCEKDEEISIQSASSISEANNEESTTVKIKTDKITKTAFECESEGKFPFDKDCKKYYVCTKMKSDYQWKIKKCPSDEVYDKKKKKCVESDSGEC